MATKTEEARGVWERPELTRMDAADAQNGTDHHRDAVYFRRGPGS